MATQELSQLQDRVPAFPPVLARKLIEEQLGASVEDAFAEFSMKPLAAASLGQVHSAECTGLVLCSEYQSGETGSRNAGCPILCMRFRSSAQPCSLPALLCLSWKL